MSEVESESSDEAERRLRAARQKSKRSFDEFMQMDLEPTVMIPLRGEGQRRSSSRRDPRQSADARLQDRPRTPPRANPPARGRTPSLVPRQPSHPPPEVAARASDSGQSEMSEINPHSGLAKMASQRPSMKGGSAVATPKWIPPAGSSAPFHIMNSRPKPPPPSPPCPAPAASDRPVRPPWRSPLCLGDHRKLPAGYGSWDDWNDPESVEREEQLANANRIEWASRGPVSEEHGGPRLWNGMPFNTEKGCWGYSSRDQLPREYLEISDFWSEEGLKLEHELVYKYRIPWQLRGPPGGERFPGDTWRNLTWRAGAKKWMLRGGKKKK